MINFALGVLFVLVVFGLTMGGDALYARWSKKNKARAQSTDETYVSDKEESGDKIKDIRAGKDITRGTWDMFHNGDVVFAEDKKLCFHGELKNPDFIYAGEIDPAVLSFEFLNSLDMKTFLNKVVEETGSSQRVILFSSGESSAVSYNRGNWRIINNTERVYFYFDTPSYHSTISCSHITSIVLYFSEQQELLDLAIFQANSGISIDIGEYKDRLNAAIYSFINKYTESMTNEFIHNLTLAPTAKIIEMGDSIVLGGEHRYNHAIRIELRTRMDHMQQVLDSHRIHKEGQAILAEHLEQAKALQLTLSNP